jgi:signal transduction histidine kinase
LLVEQIREKHYEEVEQFAQIIQQSSTLAVELITNLLDWARLQVGRMKFNPHYIDLTTLIKSATQLLNNSAQQKGISILVDAPQNLTVFGDEAMVGTILRNLISNAIKFTHPDGEIVVSAKQEKDQLVVMVADNGVGIKKSVLNKLFAIEENYSTSGTQNEKGTGLGLIMCKDFIERHGGEIWVESDPGNGSTFYFTIPQHLRKFSIHPVDMPNKSV